MTSKKIYLILCFISFIQLTTAQNFVHDFGKYSDEEFKLKRYEKDPSAEAVVIYDIGKSYFVQTDEGFELVFERQTKIKIFNKAGIKWAEFEIPYYEENSKFEEISELKGNTYNYENGQVRTTTLNTKNTFKEKYDEHWYNLKFAMPDVKEGSIIEVSYKIRSPYHFNFRSWQFQHSIPVIFSEYNVKMIPFYEYTFIMQGASKFDSYKTYVEPGLPSHFGGADYHESVYYFLMVDVPAFKDESFISSINDYIIKLDFQLSTVHQLNGTNIAVMTTWTELSEELLDNDNFGKYLKTGKKKSKDFIDTMHLATKTTLEKAKIIDRFVKTNFNWNGQSDKMTSKSVKDFLTSKTGNSADINLFLTGMLNAAGIEAFPVILSTRSHGKIKYNYPFQHFFNYVIATATIDSVIYLFDATEPLCTFSAIPARSINERGLIIQKKKVEWLAMKSAHIANIEYNFDIKLNTANDSIYEGYKLITTGQSAVEYRDKYTKSLKDLKTDLLGNNVLSTDILTANNLNQVENPFELTYNKKNAAETIDNKIIITPFCNTVITENPLKQSTRNYPVDFIYRKANKFQSIISIPKGYKLLKMPDEMIVNNKVVKIVYSASKDDDNTIKVIGWYEFKKEIFESSDYADLKDYFGRIVSKFNEKLILVKE